MKIAVVIPTRLAPRPGGRDLRDFGPELWLDGALASVRRQTLYSNFNWETYVGVDPGAKVPPYVYDHATVVRAVRPGQACAMNAAADVAATSADVLFFLEDDDTWRPCKADVQLPHLSGAPFVSCSQRMTDEYGNLLGTNDYPVPSGWVMTADLWRKVGGFNQGVKWHVDGEWLGRLNEARVRRIHLVPDEGTRLPNQLALVAGHSEVVTCKNMPFLVYRTHNGAGGMSKIACDVDCAQGESDEEEARLRERFGGLPW